MDVASRPHSLVFSLIRTPIVVTATLWTWAMVVPRALVHYTLCLIELFENTMLTIVWEYQGDNLLKFLYTHNHIPQATLKHSETRSQGVQTTDLDTHDLARNARQRRDVLMTQVLEDLVPALLQALHAMPQRGELERMSQEQTQWAKIIASQQRQLMDAKMHDESLEAYTQIAATLQVLVSRIGSVDERLIRALNVSSGHVDQQLVSLQDGLGRVSRECELDKSAISELVVRLSQLDNVLMSIAASPRILPGKTDAAVDTAGSDVADGEMEGTSKLDSGRASVEEQQVDQFSGFYSWKSMKSVASSESNLDLMKLVLGDKAPVDAETSIADIDPLTADNTEPPLVNSKMSIEKFPEIPDDQLLDQDSAAGQDPEFVVEAPAAAVAPTKEEVPLARQSDDVARLEAEQPKSQRRQTISTVFHSASASASSTKIDSAIVKPSTSRSRKFSFREELKRRSWFGKKKQ